MLPGHMAYPLMYHAPGAVYAWQLQYPPGEQFQEIPEIHFRGRVLPDYVFVFGPSVIEVMKMLKGLEVQGLRYDLAATIDHYWRDMHRPELFWHTFKPIRNYNRQNEAIYVFKRTKPWKQSQTRYEAKGDRP